MGEPKTHWIPIEGYGVVAFVWMPDGRQAQVFYSYGPGYSGTYPPASHRNAEVKG